MYNVVIGFGNYPAYLQSGKLGPYTEEELGLMWIKHVAAFSAPGMLAKYRLVLILPREVLIPDTLNLDLDQWGAKQRIDDNNKAQPWPVGPNAVFKQILWCYAHNKLQGPFLWCEPDCIPVKADWLDRLFDEYERVGKPFMGHLVDGFLSNGIRVVKHMTGNAIYPDKAYLLAPKLLECHGTAWDVYAASEILKHGNFHDTVLIQHDLGIDFPRPNPETVLYHPDKTGSVIKALNGEVPSLMIETGLAKPNPPIGHLFSESAAMQQIGKPLTEVFQGERIDNLLKSILEACQDDRDVHRKVAYFMIDNEIVNNGFWATAMRRRNQAKKKEAATAHAESPA